MAMDLDAPLAADKGEVALQQLRDADPAVYLSPSADLAAAARAALKHLHSSLAVASPVQPPPLPNLLAGPNFDAEQIWSQSELLSAPLLPHLHRQLRRLEQQPPSHPSPAPPPSKSAKSEEEPSDESEEDGEGDESEDLDEDEMEGTDDELDSAEEEEEEKEEVKGRAGNGVEDKFLKVKELEDFLADAEEQEYGGSKGGEKKKGTVDWMEDESDEDMDQGGDDGEEDDDDLDLEDFDDDDDEEDGGKSGGDIKYEDFFEESHKQQGKKRNSSTKKVHFKDELQEMEGDDSANDDVKDVPTLEDEQGLSTHEKDEQGLSTHEKERLKMRAKIEQMEKASLDPCAWTMKGEVTASSRPKNSAIEVELDFEHNVRPAPVITEEVTASLEEMIKKRIAEDNFDDVEMPSILSSKAPKKQKEMDENKSTKGLAELYADDYAQKAGLAPATLSISDEQKKEANDLFKRICLKLDALSHFHFAPKPVIEDMSIQANVPALAMEEVAPVAVSDAAMLAPEEVFEGKGDIKEDTELTQAERKRRRANKKRRYAETHKDRPAKLQKNSDM
ncbi:U3 small nucleolar ribonucleoprotein protein MPP10-like [Lolium rigidum]|uniref:U3 small nucleolar ribonucleoprotein protein MPP10-like n=1 Tax=Lolium rigidum TaxID=89674 RepID=UPI001F5DE99C|nr:U3 small nucleolar ribonucleoprotein protein MPP10-like [Lolium rigidum]